MSFDQLGLAPELLRAVADEGYTEPTPVQRRGDPARPRRPRPARRRPDRHRQDGRVRAADPPAAPRDASGARNAGNQRRGPRHPIRALVLTPTRELALQVEESVRTYGAPPARPLHRDLRRRRLRAAGPRAARRARRSSSRRPGRLLDHVGQRTIDLSRRRDPRPRRGRPDARHGLHPRHPAGPRAAAAAAPEPAVLGDVLGRDPRPRGRAPRRPGHRPGRAAATRRPSSSTRSSIPVDRERKRELLSHLIRSGRIDQALVFTRTKHGANRLAEQLDRDGIDAAAIHGNKSQGQRVRALDDFKARPRRDPRGDRGRRARPRHRGAAARRQLRAADGPRGLRPPHRAHGPRGHRRRRDLARLRRRAAAPAGHRAAAAARRSRPEVVEGFEPDRTIRAEPIRLRSPAARPRVAAHGQRGQGGSAHGQPRPSRHGARQHPAGRPVAGGRVPPAARPARPRCSAGPAPTVRRAVALPGERLRRAATGSAPGTAGVRPTARGPTDDEAFAATSARSASPRPSARSRSRAAWFASLPVRHGHRVRPGGRGRARPRAAPAAAGHGAGHHAQPAATGA